MVIATAKCMYAHALQLKLMSVERLVSLSLSLWIFLRLITQHLETKAYLWSYETQKIWRTQTHLSVLRQLRVAFAFNRFIGGADTSIILRPWLWGWIKIHWDSHCNFRQSHCFRFWLIPLITPSSKTPFRLLWPPGWTGLYFLSSQHCLLCLHSEPTVTMSEQALSSYRLPPDCSSGVMDVHSANSCRERWVILRIPSIQRDAAPAPPLQLFIWGQSPQIAQPPASHNMLYPAFITCKALKSTDHPNMFECELKKSRHTNILRFICLLKCIKDFMFSVYRLHHLLKRKQCNKYSFEL